MPIDYAISVISALDTFIYAAIVLILWNFRWTKKLRTKIFGDDNDETNTGLAVEVSELKDRVSDLERKQTIVEIESTQCDKTECDDDAD